MIKLYSSSTSGCFFRYRNQPLRSTLSKIFVCRFRNVRMGSHAKVEAMLASLQVKREACDLQKKNETMGPPTMTKSPNILIYSSNARAAEMVTNLLDTVVDKDMYIIYNLSKKEAQKDTWINQATLVVVCKDVEHEVKSRLVEYLLQGGKLLALCSNMLNVLIPSLKTEIIHENQLVPSSYGEWKKVCLLHHIYDHLVPSMKKSSQDTSIAEVPEIAAITDKNGKLHTLNVEILGKEEKWETPSIMLAQEASSGAKAIFSQIHLEVDSSQHLLDVNIGNILEQNNASRLEIFCDLLSTHFGINIAKKSSTPPACTLGYLLGKSEIKTQLLEKLKDKMKDNVLKTSKLEIQFYGDSVKPKNASESFLPIVMDQNAFLLNFAAEEYFKYLKTKSVGQLVVYVDVITSSMNVTADCKFLHGFTVIPNKMIQGQGRGGNIWLSPQGCAMFTLQLHLSLDSLLGSRVSLLQYLICVSVVHSIRKQPSYQNIDLRIKWPNDIYIGKSVKIGGILVTSLVESSNIVCNAGVGINLSNRVPTTCINDEIEKYNETNGTNLKLLSREYFLALVFNEIEYWLDVVQQGNWDKFYETYYQYWLHSDATVDVVSKDGTSRNAKIIGIDDYGFLKVKGSNGESFTVQPDGNSFDVLKGLISPK